MSLPYAQAIFASFLVTSSAFAAPVLTTIYSFGGGTGVDHTQGNIAFDKKGNIYGSSPYGGSFGGGTVYELSPPAAGQTAWTASILAEFTDRRDGYRSWGGLTRAVNGDLYGTTELGGPNGCGTLFRVHKTVTGWHKNTLWRFQGGADGCNPVSAVIVDSAGAIYGNAQGGGTNGLGVVYKIVPPTEIGGTAQESIIWNMTGSDGSSPATQMTFDGAGNLYGMSPNGGANNDGAVWELTPPAAGQTNWTETVLWAFSGTDGAAPTSGQLVFDMTGSLYGTCSGGGADGNGVAFKLSPPATGGAGWAMTTLYSFKGSKYGFAGPVSGAVLKTNGHLLVPTGPRGTNEGAIIDLAPPQPGSTDWTARTVMTFTDNDGDTPTSPLAVFHGKIYGTSEWGGGPDNSEFGSVWQVAP